jgi:site-specific DNA-cytosine methylase
MRQALSLPPCPWGEDIFDSTAPTVVATEPQSDVNGIELDQTPRRASERIAQGVMEQIDQWIDHAHAQYVTEIQRRLGLRLMPKERRAGLRLAPEILAVLQGFPPDVVFVGSKTSRSRQIGNAVPPPMARVLAETLHAKMHDLR